MSFSLRHDDCFGFYQPLLDAHSMGLANAARLLEDCGYRTFTADPPTRGAVDGGSAAALANWIRSNGVTVLGFAYRLSPADGIRFFSAFIAALRESGLLDSGKRSGKPSSKSSGGSVRGIFFAGLPETCRLARERFPEIIAVFPGEETPEQTLRALGVPSDRIPVSASEASAYDEERLSFGRNLIARGDLSEIRPVDNSRSPRFGKRGEKLADRVAYRRALGLPPLIRAHMGPYLADREAAVRRFMDWTRQLAAGGLLDVLSIGTSQLTQERFGEDWGNLPNGGGVPIATAEEYAEVWKAARPMFVRTYAGTRDIEKLARMYESTIDNAWHALSFWWFCAIDGRGPNSVAENLAEHHAALRSIAAAGKPFEPNVPHHFAFRGADDVSYIVSGYIAARAAKRVGIRTLVLQTMLNTPKSTWGVQDLAKARALLALVKTLEGSDFRVFLQPRAGLDYFSPDTEKAKTQLAAATALMDDIEAGDPHSPQIIHVVSYSEANDLADPETVEESIRITRLALERYRRERARGNVRDMGKSEEVEFRTRTLLDDARIMIQAIEESIGAPYSAQGMYEALASGFFPLPGLTARREEFAAACAISTRTYNGGVAAVDERGKPISAAERAGAAAETARRRRGA